MSDKKRFREATWWAWPPSASRPPPPRTRPNNQYPRYYELGPDFSEHDPTTYCKKKEKKEHVFYFSARRYHHKGFARWYWFLCQKNLYFWQVIISQIFVFVFASSYTRHEYEEGILWCFPLRRWPSCRTASCRGARCSPAPPSYADLQPGEAEFMCARETEGEK